MFVYLLLAKFKVLTVNYKPSFSCSDLWPNCKAEKLVSIAYNMDLEIEVNRTLTLEVPQVTLTEFLLTLSVRYQTDVNENKEKHQ